MSGKNKNNSIIFLTTLSVYLGLVLVGAPTVLAQAALTRNFDVQSEIEVKDDLDNKPDDEKLSEGDFPLAFVELLDEIKRAVKDGNLALPLPMEFGAAGDFQIVASGVGSGGAIGANVSDARFEQILRDAIGDNFRRKAIALADFNGDGFKTVRINLTADGEDLTLRVSFSKNKAAQFADFLNRKFSARAKIAKDETVKQVYKNTEASAVGTVADNYISIATHLPRGSLNELLKQSVKAKSE